MAYTATQEVEYGNLWVVRDSSGKWAGCTPTELGAKAIIRRLKRKSSEGL